MSLRKYKKEDDTRIDRDKKCGTGTRKIQNTALENEVPQNR